MLFRDLTHDQMRFFQNALPVEYGTNSTYKQAHIPKINSSPVKILHSSQQVLAEFAELGLQICLNC